VGAPHHKLLIVDDEHTIADTLVQIFSANGYEAHAAYSAEQAAEIVAGWVETHIRSLLTERTPKGDFA